MRAFSFPASPERSRLRGWLEGTLAGLCELHLLRERQERRVRQALRLSHSPAKQGDPEGGGGGEPAPEDQLVSSGAPVQWKGPPARGQPDRKGMPQGRGGVGVALHWGRGCKELKGGGGAVRPLPLFFSRGAQKGAAFGGVLRFPSPLAVSKVYWGAKKEKNKDPPVLAKAKSFSSLPPSQEKRGGSSEPKAWNGEGAVSLQGD